MPDSVEALLRGLFQGPPLVRDGCAAILDHAPHDARIESALLAASADPDWRVRKSALHSLSCAACKPDGCLTTDGIGALVSSMLGDPDSRVRMMCAGSMMWGQAGRSERVVAAFRHVLATSRNPKMRERAATFLASTELPKDSMPYREWAPKWEARIAALVGT